MHCSLPRPAGVLAALALLAASTHLSAQKALVVCPPADASGCGRVAQVLAGMEGADGGSLFPGGVDRRFEDLRTATPAEMHAYSLVFVPSFANASYDLLREAPVRDRLGGILSGRVAVWSGTPDRGTTTGASAGKLELIRNLARWAAAGDAPGLVVLQDFSDPRPDGTSRRYDWVRGVAGIEVAAAPVMRTYRGVRTADGDAAREIVGNLAYENMASFGLAAPADGGAVRAFGLEGPGKPTAEDAVVLVAWDRSASGSATALSVSSPAIDILPATINYNTTSLVQVRVLSSAGFDAVSIDPSTVRFVIDGVLPGAPVGTFSSGTFMTSVSDLNGDGLPDRVLQLRMTDLKAAGLSGPNHQFVVQGQATSGPFQATDPTQPPVVSYPAVTQATVVPDSATIAVGGTVDLDAQLFAGSTRVSGRVVTWNSLDASATVSSSGMVTGLSAGMARIVAMSEGKADTAEVTVTGDDGSDHAPTATNDAYATDEDTPLDVATPGVLANDIDPEGTALTAALVSGPAHGSLMLNADGSFTYTPAADYNGSDSFTYKADDGASDSNVATVTLTVDAVMDAPVAANDAYSVDEDNPLAVVAPGVLGNDSNPEGGTLSAVPVSTTSNGSLALGADGSFTYTPNADYFGSDQFTYKANNGSGDSNVATVTITVNPVNDPPVAVADAYATDEDSPLNVATPGVLGNDTDPEGTALIATLMSGPAHGSLTLNADGSFTYTPAANYFGNDQFTYKANDGAEDSNTATVTIMVNPANDSPTAGADAFDALGNVLTAIGATGVLANDTDMEGSPLSLVAGTTSSTSGGTVVLNADGSFTYISAAGFSGSDSFTYSVSDGTTISTGTVTMTVAGRYWFVDASAASGGDGRQNSRFQSLAPLNGAGGAGDPDQPGDVILVHSGTYTSAISLEAAQQLIGQGIPANLTATVNGQAVTLLTAGSSPTIGTTSGNTIQLAGSNTLRGFNLGNAPGSALSGSGFGTLTISQLGINTNGQALNLATGVLSGNFAALISTGGTNNIFLSGVSTTGTATLGTASDGLSGATGDALRIVGGTGSFTYPGSIANTSSLAVNITGKTGGIVTLSGPLNPAAAARGISVSGNTGGTISFTGGAQKISTGTGPGVSLSSNTGASIHFTGGGLAIATTTGSGFNAAGGGTVTVTGAANTIASAGGVALNVANTTIGAGGLLFRSISADGGTSGIVLDNTGSTAGLSVAGTGAAGTGGTIQNTTGDAVSLTSTVNPGLAFMTVQNNGGSGIRASLVSGLALSNALVDNNGDTSGGTEAGILLLDLSGTSQISASTIRNSFEDNVRWTPSSGAQTLTLTNTTVGPNNPTSGNGGVNVTGTGTANATLNVIGGTYTQNRSFGIGTSFTDNSAHTVNVSGATFTDNGMAIGLATALNADVTFDIADNPGILRSRTNAIQVLAGATSTGASQIRGRIRGNTIGDDTVDSGARDGIGITIEVNDDADAVIGVTGNSIRHSDQDGIFVQSRDPNTGDGDPATAGVDLTLTGNTIGTPDNNLAFPAPSVYGVRVESRHATTMCLNVAGNTSSGAGTGTGFRVRQRETSAFKLERLTGAANAPGNVSSFVAGQNTAGSTANATVATTFTAVANGACRTP